MKKTFTLILMTFCLSTSFAQSIVSISPSTVTAGQTLNVTITGSNTHFTAGSSTEVEFGFSSCSGSTNVIVNSDVNLLVNEYVPSITYNGYYDVQVYNQSDGYIVIDRGLFVSSNITAPITISPDSGAPGQTLNITITGNGTQFMQGSSSTLDFIIDFNQQICDMPNVVFSVATPTNNTLASTVFTIPPGTPDGYYELIFDGGSQYYRIDNVLHVTSGVSVSEIEKEYKLTIGPNPFNNHTSIEYTLQHSEAVKLEVYDLFGRKILLKDPGLLSAGKYSLSVDAADLNFTSGIYLIRFMSGDRSVTKRVMFNVD